MVTWGGSWNWYRIDHTDTGCLDFGDTDSGAYPWDYCRHYKHLLDSTAMKELPILCNGDTVRAILDGRQTQDRRPIKPQPRWEESPQPSLKDPSLFCGRYCIGNVYGELGPDYSVEVDEARSPFGAPGDHLYVREHWAYKGWSSNGGNRRHVHYHADKSRRTVCFDSFAEMFEAGPKQNVVYPPGFDDLGQEDQRHIRFSLIWKWWERQGSKPSIHMPRWASRITLEVERVWCERVQEISKEDAIAEGIEVTEFFDGGAAYVSHPAKDVSYLEHDPTTAFLFLWDSIYSKRGFGWDTNCWIFGCEFKVLEVAR